MLGGFICGRESVACDDPRLRTLGEILFLLFFVFAVKKCFPVLEVILLRKVEWCVGLIKRVTNFYSA